MKIATLNKNKPWIVINLVGMIVYLYFSSWGWPVSGEQGFIGGAGDPIVWALSVFPVLVICLLVNIGWLIRLSLEIYRHGGWASVPIFLIVATLWAASIEIDHLHEYSGALIHQAN